MRKTIFVSFWENVEIFRRSKLIRGGYLLIVKTNERGIKIDPESQKFLYGLKNDKKIKTKIEEVKVGSDGNLLKRVNEIIMDEGKDNVQVVFFESKFEGRIPGVTGCKKNLKANGIRLAERWTPAEDRIVWENEEEKPEEEDNPSEAIEEEVKKKPEEDDPSGMKHTFSNLKFSTGKREDIHGDVYENKAKKREKKEKKQGIFGKKGRKGEAPKREKKEEKKEKAVEEDVPENTGSIYEDTAEEETEKKEPKKAEKREDSSFPETLYEADEKMKKAKINYIYYLRARLFLMMQTAFNLPDLDSDSFYKICMMLLKSGTSDNFKESVEAAHRIKVTVQDAGYHQMKREAMKYYQIIRAIES